MLLQRVTMLFYVHIVQYISKYLSALISLCPAMYIIYIHVKYLHCSHYVTVIFNITISSNDTLRIMRDGSIYVYNELERFVIAI